MSVFEPELVRASLKSTLTAKDHAAKFDREWKANVDKKVHVWAKGKDMTDMQLQQLRWEANIVEYVDFVHALTSVHGNAKPGTVAPSLKKNIPLLGPYFVPPSYLDIQKRQPAPYIEPETSYFVPITIVHPFYFPGQLNSCPVCESPDTRWDGWTGAGPRDVHGVRREERALGYQLRCKMCKESKARQEPGSDEKLEYCFAATSKVFWQRWEHWKIPRGVPMFLSRCAVSRELFDLVVELRPKSTSAGIAEHVKQLHLLEYGKARIEYLTYFKGRNIGLRTVPFQCFSDPDALSGYRDQSITHDLVTDVYLDFVKQTREDESSDYARTLQGICLSFDNTFSSAKKATVVNKDKERKRMMKGGIFSILNEKNEIICWRLCQTASAGEMREVLKGIVERYRILGIDLPEMLVADNCCTVRGSALQVMPLVKVLLDVYHFLMRYVVEVINGAKNPLRSLVAKDITDAILKRRAGKGVLAEYWNKEEQEERLVAAYNKWAEKGNVWGPGAATAHSNQLGHVRKGCLARPRQDIPSDGSRIEGSHKGWNSLQRTQPSGIEVFSALGHDFVLRRNVRVALAHGASSSSFIGSTHGSHHIRLVDYAAQLFNELFKCEKKTSIKNSQPTLPRVASGEVFGLVRSEEADTFGGLLTIKDEPDDLEESPEDLLDRIISDESCDVNVPECIGEGSALDSSFVDLTQEMPRVRSDAEAQAPAMRAPAMNMSGPSTPLQRSLNKRKFGADPCDIEVFDVDAESSSVCTSETQPPLAKRLRQDNKPQIENLSEATVLAPVVESDSQDTAGRTTGVQSFFKARKTRSSSCASLEPSSLPSLAIIASTTATSNSVTAMAPSLDAPLKLSSNHPNLTRSQGNDEFFLFMDLRLEEGWASFNMNAQRWVAATDAYNRRLQALCEKRNIPFIKKNPRALLDKLGEIEPQIKRRIATGDYYNSKKTSDTFWTKHCAAVALIKKEPKKEPAAEPPETIAPGSGQSSVKPAKDARKAQSCTRCKVIMYPGPTGAPENHKKAYCSDGAAQKSKATDGYIPPWPQPSGIFAKGTHFDAVAFLTAIRELHEKIAGQPAGSGDYSMEDQAFSQMLLSRVKELPGKRAGFILSDLTFTYETPENLVVEEDGIKYLRIDCLHH
ncbi:hypothetical protein FPV67DRAFT_1681291 [Lyophyllum atratum]|nr:hypothetical protein FPV67DRAFT_1681291 [Lyophyllum atratum]